MKQNFKMSSVVRGRSIDMNVDSIFKHIDEFYNWKYGRIIFLAICLIFCIMFCLKLRKLNKMDSKTLTDTFDTYKEKSKLMITLTGVYLVFTFKLMVGIKSKDIVEVLLSNSVFMSLAIFGSDEGIKDLKDESEREYLVNFSGLVATALAFLDMVITYLIYYIPFNDNNIFTYMLILVNDTLTGPFSLIFFAQLLNYLILDFLIKINYVNLEDK